YPLLYLSTVSTSDVIANFSVSNDSRIVLTDSTTSAINNLNQTQPLPIATKISDIPFAQPALPPPEERVPVVVEQQQPIFLEIAPTLPPQTTRVDQVQQFQTDRRQDVAVLYLVYVGPDGQEGQRVLLPLSDLRDIPGLLERLKDPKIRSGLYRLYYQEP